MSENKTPTYSEMVRNSDFLNFAIKKQKKLIRNAGHEPTWDLFSKTFGWYQISQQLSTEEQEIYKNAWEKA